MHTLNLKLLYGAEYRTVMDESAFCPGENKRNPWYHRLPCKFGHIYPYSIKMLAFYCQSGKIRNRLHREHPEIKAINWSDYGEAIFLFTPDQFKIVAEFAKPIRKRRLSPDHRQKLTLAGTDALKRYRNSILNGIKSSQKSSIAIGPISEYGLAREMGSENNSTLRNPKI